MKDKLIKSVGVKKLKDQLSAYLREVKNGNVVLVTDRGDVVAELRKPGIHRDISENYSLEQELIEKGFLIPPLITKKEAPRSPVTMKPGTTLRILNEDRGE
ncbi:antitoxin PHD [candidate division CSSED10-310 bacterium]|uniref:Antitoxin PHD n=1 Tax=candidate division CSSED10-310 bacterium TaxID=2855610 RepID=A0ABV6Z6C8_UNCC1